MKFRVWAVSLGLSGLLCASSSAVDRGAPSVLSAKAERSREDKKVQTVLRLWVRALGGEARLREFKSVEAEQVLEIKPGESGIVFHTTEMADGRFHYELTAGTSVLSGYDGGARAWEQNTQYGFGFVAPQLFDRTFWRTPALIALRLDHQYRQIVSQGDAPVGQQACEVLALTDSSGLTDRWFFAKKTGQLIRIERSSSFGDVVTIDFDDFRKVSRLTLPFLIKQTSRNRVTECRRLNLTIDGRVDPSVFAPSAAQLREANQIDGILAHYEAVSEKAAPDQRIHTRVTESELQSFPAGIISQVKFTQKGNDRLLREENIPGEGKVFTGYDGKLGWFYGEIQGYRVLKGPELEEFLLNKEVQRAEALRAQLPIRHFFGVHELFGKKVYKIGLATPETFSGFYYFDCDQGFLVRIEGQYKSNPKSAEVTATVDYGDFRRIGSVSLPFRTTYTLPTRKTVIICKSIAVDVPVADAVFRPRKDD